MFWTCHICEEGKQALSLCFALGTDVDVLDVSHLCLSLLCVRYRCEGGELAPVTRVMLWLAGDKCTWQAPFSVLALARRFASADLCAGGWDAFSPWAGTINWQQCSLCTLGLGFLGAVVHVLDQQICIYAYMNHLDACTCHNRSVYVCVQIKSTQ